MDSHITEVERNRRKEERKRQKDMYKALETPEQKRARRLEKKEDKERKRKQLMGWGDDYMGYTNDDNPFGDSNLHETFVWGKKYEQQGVKNIDEEKIRKINKEKMIANRQELEKVKQARLEREREREERIFSIRHHRLSVVVKRETVTVEDMVRIIVQMSPRRRNTLVNMSVNYFNPTNVHIMQISGTVYS